MGIVAKYRNQRAWARNGVVHITDDQTGHESTMSYTEFTKARIVHLMQMRDHPDCSRSDRAELQRAISEMAEVALEAKLQGDPLKPLTRSQQQLQRHQAQERAREKLADLQKIVTLDEAQLATANAMAEQGFAPTLCDEFGRPLTSGGNYAISRDA